MILTFLPEQFTLESEYYYSLPFLQDEKDALISIAIWTGSSATASMQASLNSTDWVDVFNSSFTVANTGLQTFTECHIGLVYRIKIDVIPTKAQILI